MKFLFDQNLSPRYGHPLKVVWVHLGDCSTERIRSVLAESAQSIAAFDEDEQASFSTLRP